METPELNICCIGEWVQAEETIKPRFCCHSDLRRNLIPQAEFTILIHAADMS